MHFRISNIWNIKTCLVFEGARYPTGAGVGQGTGKKGKGTFHFINFSFSLFIIATCYSHLISHLDSKAQ